VYDFALLDRHRGVSSVRIQLVCIPSSDTAFAAAAHEALIHVPPWMSQPAGAEDLQRRLQASYPGAVVRPREALAEVSTTREIVWYVTNRAYRSRIAAIVEVPAAREAAFQTYVERVTEWQTAVRLKEVRLTPEFVGSEWAVRWEFLGRATDGVMRVVEADPPNSVRFEATGHGIKVWYATSFTPSPGGTIVRVVGDYDLPDGILPKIVDRLFIERGIQRQIEAAHKSLAELCRMDVEHSEAS
jgi:hypothetical protein